METEGPVPVVSIIPGIPSRLSDDVRRRVDQKAAEWEEGQVARAQENHAISVDAATEALWREWGKRYEQATFESFVTNGTADNREVIVMMLRKYGESIGRYVGEGMGIVLTGAPGTGKDHLLAALAKVAINAGLRVKWTSGTRLFRRFRDDIGANRSEHEAMREYTKPDILIVSDPAWEREPLTRHQRAKLGEIIDERTNNLRPTWASINADNRHHANQLLGSALVDRLANGALSSACNWPGARKPLEDFEGVRLADLGGPNRRQMKETNA